MRFYALPAARCCVFCNAQFYAGCNVTWLCSILVLSRPISPRHVQQREHYKRAAPFCKRAARFSFVAYNVEFSIFSILHGRSFNAIWAFKPSPRRSQHRATWSLHACLPLCRISPTCFAKVLVLLVLAWIQDRHMGQALPPCWPFQMHICIAGWPIVLSRFVGCRPESRLHHQPNTFTALY